MMKTSLKIKAARAPKFDVCDYTRCNRCGRPRSMYHKFDLRRVCPREPALRGELPGVIKNSWQESGVAGPGLRRNCDEKGINPQ